MTTALDRACANGAEWLESRHLSGAHFARYQVGSDLFGDSVSDWFCTECGARVDDPSEGCEACGAGQPEDEDEDNQPAPGGHHA